MTTTAMLVNRHTAGPLLAPARPAYGPGGEVLVQVLAPFYWHEVQRAVGVMQVHASDATPARN